MHPHTAMRMRGTFKVVLVAIVSNNILTLVFAKFANFIDAAPNPSVVTAFSLVTSLMLGFWVQTDARRAYKVAEQGGFIRRAPDGHPAVALKPGCPRRWLVLLHLELNPRLAGVEPGR